MAYIFDPERLHEIARGAVGLPFEAMVDHVIDALDQGWPGFIETRQDWVFSLAAGATGIMTVLHGSLSEYVIIFGTPVGTEAFSGRYHLDIYDFVMAGEMRTYTEQQYGEAVVTLPGERALLRRGQVKGFKLSGDCWMLEYGRGVVPSSLPIALGDAIFSAMDGKTLLKTVQHYGRQVVRSLLKGKV